MPGRGENIYRRKDGRWEGRYIKDKIGNKVKYGYVYAHTYQDIKEKLHMVKSSVQKDIPRKMIFCFPSCAADGLQVRL